MAGLSTVSSFNGYSSKSPNKTIVLVNKGADLPKQHFLAESPNGQAFRGGGNGQHTSHLFGPGTPVLVPFF
jgi:hypothetical protein